MCYLAMAQAQGPELHRYSLCLRVNGDWCFKNMHIESVRNPSIRFRLTIFTTRNQFKIVSLALLELFEGSGHRSIGITLERTRRQNDQRYPP